MSHWGSTRRELIVNSATGAMGLCVGFAIPWTVNSSQALGQDAEHLTTVLNTFVKIYSDNMIEIVVVKAEMGQGVATSLAMLICEELEADWQKVRVELKGEMPPYFNPQTGGMAATFGSSSVSSQFERLRVVGATVKELLLTVAADKLATDIKQIHAVDSKIYDQAGNLKFTYGELAQAAANYSLSKEARLKDAKDFKLIGSRALHIDTIEKIEGQAVFGIDVNLPNMLYAAIKHHPAFGAQLKNFDELARDIPFEYKLIEMPDAILLLGPSYWQAQRILNNLKPQYELSELIRGRNQAWIEAQLSSALNDREGIVAHEEGHAAELILESDQVVEASYHVPFLAHGALEPLCCTAQVLEDRLEFWIPTQSAQLSTFAIAQALNRPADQIKINVTFLGGSFGRKVETDFVVQAAIAAEKAGGRPVKLIWSRTEDTQHDRYRPAFKAKMQAGISQNRLSVWIAKNAGPAIGRQSSDPGELNMFASQGFANLPYRIDHQKILQEKVDLGIPVGYWRSVGKSHNTFFVESFIDEIAERINVDPMNLRLELLEAKPRARALLEKLAEISGWYDSPDRSRMGLAYMEGYNSLAAMISLVKVKDRKVTVDKIWCAVDCGRVVNFDGAEAQIQGGAIFGLAAAMYGKVTFSSGRVEQSTFADLPSIRLANCPSVEVAFMESNAAIGGLGELATPLVAPAVCNGIFRHTQQRPRRLPINEFSFS